MFRHTLCTPPDRPSQNLSSGLDTSAFNKAYWHSSLQQQQLNTTRTHHLALSYMLFRHPVTSQGVCPFSVLHHSYLDVGTTFLNLLGPFFRTGNYCILDPSPSRSKLCHGNCPAWEQPVELDAQLFQNLLTRVQTEDPWTMFTYQGMFLNRFIKFLFFALSTFFTCHPVPLALLACIPPKPNYVNGLGRVLKVLPLLPGQHFPNNVGPFATPATTSAWE